VQGTNIDGSWAAAAAPAPAALVVAPRGAVGSAAERRSAPRALA